MSIPFILSILLSLSTSTKLGCTQQQQDTYPRLRLPRIDISKYMNGSPQEKQEIITSFKQYMHEYGSFSIFNHGISSDLIDRMESTGLEFFNRPSSYKNMYSSNGIGTPGYEPIKTLSASKAYGDYENDGDYTEMFSFFNHLHGSNDYHTFYPSATGAPEELFNASMEYIPLIHGLFKTLNELTSESLGLDKNYFNNLHSKPHLQLRYFYYPEMNVSETSELIENNKFRISPHKDWLGFTLFHAGKSRGLQNEVGGIWMDCVTNGDVEYDIFVNVGELFDIWTNEYYPANQHRVILEPKERITFSFFTGPNDDSLIEPINGCYECNKYQQKQVSRTAAQHAQMRFSTGDNQNPNGDKFFTLSS